MPQPALGPITSTFDLPLRLAHKGGSVLIADDDRHFAAIAASLRTTTETVSDRLDAQRRTPTRTGKEAVERDSEIRQLSARLRTLRRFGLDLCLGRMVGVDGTVTYLGRTGLTSSTGDQLLLDWRAPAAAPFFAATHADPRGLSSRRRYRWKRSGDDFRVVDYWDEAFSDTTDESLAPDDNSAFIATLNSGRSPRMRDVLATIATDQDAIIRAGSPGCLVVDGGPGTGKTVVALHRAAYLLYSDPRVSARRGGVLVVGPHNPYLAYVADVLPDLGAEGAALCTLRDLVPEGADAVEEPDPTVAQLKSSASWMDAIEKAVGFYEDPPSAPVTVESDWGDVVVTTADWVQAFDAPQTGTPHNEAREDIWQELIDIATDRYPGIPGQELVAALRSSVELVAALNRGWPMLNATDIVGDLWTVPAYLRMCAPWLSVHDREMLRQNEVKTWSSSDLPLLDAARRRLGDRDAVAHGRRRAAAAAAEMRRKADVVAEMVAAEGDRESLLTQFVRGGLSEALVDEDSLPQHAIDRFSETFAHVVVDEAQELTDAEWQMLRARCPSGSFTVVGDRAQARAGFTESWTERLSRNGLRGVDVAHLRVNYRTPQEAMDAAEPVIRSAIPDANVPTSIRSNGIPVTYGSRADLDAVLTSWLDTNDDGIACVIGDSEFEASDRVSSLTPQTAKGLEFDLVVLVEADVPANVTAAGSEASGANVTAAGSEASGAYVTAAVDRYVAMTRTTQQLVILR
ncbi:hypothetical protein GOEFS_046_00560 [Gordonia effusa NBRC 100432]|uniref:UvrD-like helicase ATP-binding domain-containing protein n=1 Tax=Gordonia effusa NBRC 100432 TaxID=1077974 RepID=H0QZ49_9ACTN|nr:RNA polymerase recycling motor ATPase HelR [Gordonia effusa]GAB18100.1 hypothetical protein GOEFS_046_00560 [Gordonia effusa NBRC 100432]